MKVPHNDDMIKKPLVIQLDTKTFNSMSHGTNSFSIHHNEKIERTMERSSSVYVLDVSVNISLFVTHSG